MPSHRDRSRERDRPSGRDREYRRGERSASPKRGDARDRGKDRDKKKDKERERERGKGSRRDADGTPSSEEELLDLKAMGVKEIGEDDYFLKSGEYRLWLKEDRGKYLDELSSESAHKYFRKFVRRWNDGALKEIYYRAPGNSTAAPASSQTGYKWSFASNRSRVDSMALAAARADVDRLTHASTSTSAPTAGSGGPSVGPSLPPSSGSGSGSGSARALGPSLPTAADRQYALEASSDDRIAQRKASRAQAYSRADEFVPRATGREGKMDERRATNAENKEWRDKDSTAGLEVDEGSLMGDSGGFAAALRAREDANARRNDRKTVAMADRRAADQERLDERRRKESSTMDMFKALAKERFG